ncbi:MAG: hypothetical protein Q4B30_06685 [Coriobacteriaceae bacterium]|nr:hypothetical protein [Coriobacteriaceae bacterium]
MGYMDWYCDYLYGQQRHTDGLHPGHSTYANPEYDKAFVDDGGYIYYPDAAVLVSGWKRDGRLDADSIDTHTLSWLIEKRHDRLARIDDGLTPSEALVCEGDPYLRYPISLSSKEPSLFITWSDMSYVQQLDRFQLLGGRTATRGEEGLGNAIRFTTLEELERGMRERDGRNGAIYDPMLTEQQKADLKRYERASTLARITCERGDTVYDVHSGLLILPHFGGITHDEPIGYDFLSLDLPLLADEMSDTHRDEPWAKALRAACKDKKDSTTAISDLLRGNTGGYTGDAFRGSRENGAWHDELGEMRKPYHARLGDAYDITSYMTRRLDATIVIARPDIARLLRSVTALNERLKQEKKELKEQGALKAKAEEKDEGSQAPTDEKKEAAAKAGIAESEGR